MSANHTALRDYVDRLSDTELDELIRLALQRRLSGERDFRSHVIVDGNSSVLFTVYPAPAAVQPNELVELDEATLLRLGYKSESEFRGRLADHS